MYFKITIESAESENSLLTTDRREFRIRDGLNIQEVKNSVKEQLDFMMKCEEEQATTRARDK